MSARSTDPGPIKSEFADDADMVELLNLFVSDLDGRSERLVELLTQSRLDELKVLAHQLKGAAGGYGYPSLSVAAGVLEQRLTLPDRDLRQLQQSVDELVNLCRRAIRGHRTRP